MIADILNELVLQHGNSYLILTYQTLAFRGTSKKLLRIAILISDLLRGMTHHPTNFQVDA